MTDVKIDDDIPVPKMRSQPERWPFSKLEIGQSFEVPVEGLRERHSVRLAAYRAGKRTGRTFTTRKSGVGVRVWRVD